MQAPLSLYVRNFHMSKVLPQYITLVVSASHNKYFPLIGLSHWKLNFLTPKTPWTSQRKACRCRKLLHGTRRVFLRMRVRTRQFEHSLFIRVWTFGAGPPCRTRSAGPHTRTHQCECTFRCRASTNVDFILPYQDGVDPASDNFSSICF